MEKETQHIAAPFDSSHTAIFFLMGMNVKTLIHLFSHIDYKVLI